MAFNGSGTYNLPAGNPVATGTTISSSTTNTTNSDIATALTNCVTRDGQSTPSANLPMNSKKLTGLAAGTSAGDSVRYEQVVLTSALGTNVATFLATPSSANLAAALTDETGSGAAVFATSPTLVTPVLGTPTSGNLANCTNAIGYGLKSATTTVSISSATAPTTGQVLAATSSTTATWQNAPGVGNSEVIVNTGNGYGSTNTRIRRFTTTQSSVGTDITYADSAANGASFTINTTGIYAISYTERPSSAGYFGISVNSTELSTSIDTIADTNRIALSANGASLQATSVSVTTRLASGDVVRAHVGAAGAYDASFAQVFRIRRVGSI